IGLHDEAPHARLFHQLGGRGQRAGQGRGVGSGHGGRVLPPLAVLEGARRYGDVVPRPGQVDGDRLPDTAAGSCDECRGHSALVLLLWWSTTAGLATGRGLPAALAKALRRGVDVSRLGPQRSHRALFPGPVGKRVKAVEATCVLPRDLVDLVVRYLRRLEGLPRRLGGGGPGAVRMRIVALPPDVPYTDVMT